MTYSPNTAASMLTHPMKRYSAVMVRDGTIRRLIYDAVDEGEGRDIAKKWGVGFEGEAADQPIVKPTEPEAFSLKDARRLLGEVSRATIYRWLNDGRLERVRGIRRLLITRKSIMCLGSGCN